MKRGEIWVVDLPQPVGGQSNEQFGTRPAVIVLSDDSPKSNPMTMIIPFTSKIEAERFPYTLKVFPSSRNGLTMSSIIMIFQLRAISPSRLIRRIGELEEEILIQVNEGLNNLLGL